MKDEYKRRITINGIDYEERGLVNSRCVVISIQTLEDILQVLLETPASERSLDHRSAITRVRYQLNSSKKKTLTHVRFASNHQFKAMYVPDQSEITPVYIKSI